MTVFSSSKEEEEGVVHGLIKFGLRDTVSTALPPPSRRESGDNSLPLGHLA